MSHSQTTRAATASTGGRYQVGEQLAAGGVGTIYRAFDRLAERHVAYKRVRLERESLRARITALFRREYEMLVLLQHPNTVEAYDYGLDTYGPYYTMELLSGYDLTGVVPLPWRNACRVLRDVASALSLIHARRLVHRDVSPNNVRITDEGTAKLLDFGALTSFGKPAEIAGTPQFMAPEAYHGDPLDQRTDLFSLGALAYMALTGDLCFPTRGLHDLERVWERPVPHPSSLVPDIPPQLDELVLSLVRLDREARPASAAHVVERLTTLAELPPEKDERAIAFSYLRHPPLAERDALMGELGSLCDGAQQGRGTTGLLEAAPGLGRTALLDRFCINAQLAGVTVLRGEGGGQMRAYDFCRQLVQVGLHSYPDPVAQTREADITTRVFLLDGSEESARSAVEAVERRARMATWLRQRLLDFSLRNPLLLVVDDAERVDPDSLAVIASMIDEAEQYPLFLLVSTGSLDEVDPHVRSKLRQAKHTWKLAPLSESGMCEVIETMFGQVPNVRTTARLIHRESAGNPGAAIDLLRVLMQRGQIVYTCATFTLQPHIEVLERSDSVLLARTVGLGQEPLGLLELLSVHDGALRLEQLTKASRKAPREVVLALERLTGDGLVLEAQESYFVGSELMRSAIVRGLAPERARKHHEALAEALLAEGGSGFEARIAAGYHLLQSGPERELEGATIIALASRERTYEAPLFTRMAPRLGEALAIYRKHGRSDEQCLDLLVPLGVLGFYGDLESQRRHLEPAIAALSNRTGLTLTRRLTPKIGAKLALYVGLLFAVLRDLFSRRKRTGLKLAEDLERYCMAISAGVAAAASACESREACEIAAWQKVFSVLPENTSANVSYEFGLATAELSIARRQSAARRYEHIRTLMSGPVPGMDENRREQLILGCLNGLAQAASEESDPAALTLADELERGSAFFAPYAETARVGYYANRGDERGLELHRLRAEALALRGGLSWSAISILALRCLYGALMAGNVIGAVRAVADLERLRGLTPALDEFCELAQAHLDHLRGQHERAVAIYERVIDAMYARRGVPYATYWLDRSFQAAALIECGEFQRAKELCEHCLSQGASEEIAGRDLVALSRRLATAEAGLGHHAEAAAILDTQIREVGATDNPLFGLVHRDRALVSILLGDTAAFERHREFAERLLKSSGNPWLVTQYESLLARAARVGLGPRAADAGAETDSLDLLDSTVIEETSRAEDEPEDEPAQKRTGAA